MHPFYMWKSLLTNVRPDITTIKSRYRASLSARSSLVPLYSQSPHPPPQATTDLISVTID